MKKRTTLGMTVVESSEFTARAKQVLSPKERDDLVDLLAHDPTCGVLIQGTGGVRKVRFGTQGRGKSSGVRVIFYFHSQLIPVFLLTLFAKNEKDDLTKREKNGLRQIVDAIVSTYGR